MAGADSSSAVARGVRPCGGAERRRCRPLAPPAAAMRSEPLPACAAMSLPSPPRAGRSRSRRCSPARWSRRRGSTSRSSRSPGSPSCRCSGRSAAPPTAARRCASACVAGLATNVPGLLLAGLHDPRLRRLPVPARGVLLRLPVGLLGAAVRALRRRLPAPSASGRSASPRRCCGWRSSSSSRTCSRGAWRTASWRCRC